ncbi:LGFP repeat-containing protein [Saccharopolyspora sp. 5N708]|uniref:LGFP repeat-containing protein n=1 Tax=Saccharopolyspora sp. 5N708 TaxID=3457424 RepID=UPI003FD4235C
MNVKRFAAAIAAAAVLLGLTATAPAAAQTEPSTSAEVPSEPTAAPRSQAPTAPAEADPGEGAIRQRYESMSPEERAQVGAPVGPEVVELEGLRWQDFTHARFYWTPDTAVTVVRGMIYSRFLDLGGHAELGVPITDELASSGGGRYSDFRTTDGVIHSAIYWSTRTGAHLVVGRILEHFRELGEDATFGYPATDTRLTPDGFGAYNHFVTPNAQHENASIYWTQPSGPNAVRGAIRDKWAASGWERGPLGYPITDELAAPDGVGRYNQFNGDGRFPAGIAWSPQTGAHSMQGVIAQRYIELSGPGGVLGYPTTDEQTTADGIGRYNHFTGAGGASIYWTPWAGAHEVYGGIRARWAQLGWERSYLGYPVTGESNSPLGRANEFERGFIEWHRDSGEVVDYLKN